MTVENEAFVDLEQLLHTQVDLLWRKQWRETEKEMNRLVNAGDWDTAVKIANNINLDLDIDNIYLSIDSTVILGLIINEIVTNAFKYGISYKNKSFIKIELMLISNKELLFTCANSKIKSEQVETPDSGIGLKNIKKRLDLLFNDTYSLLIDDTENEYKIILKIPVHAN